MSQLTELISKTIHDIQFNGCTLPESIIRLQFDNIVACAKLEESIERNTKYLESIGTAHGNGGNDRPNVIGDMITEPSLTPDQLVKGEWYCLQTKVARINNWIFQFNNYKDGRILFYMCSDKGENTNNMGGFFLHNNVLSIRHATKEEVLKYFPDEKFNEPEPKQVGRWYKCLSGDNMFTEGKWYFCQKNDPLGVFAFIDNNKNSDGWGMNNSLHFDLTNPQLNNPDAEPADYVNPITN